MNVFERTEVQQAFRPGIPAERDGQGPARLVLRGELDLANVAQTDHRLQELLSHGARSSRSTCRTSGSST